MNNIEIVVDHPSGYDFNTQRYIIDLSNVLYIKQEDAHIEFQFKEERLAITFLNRDICLKEYARILKAMEGKQNERNI